MSSGVPDFHGDHDGHTISAHVPRRPKPGFGCPHCGKPLPLLGREMLLAAVIGLECCGYVPTGAEAFRWAIAGRMIAGLEGSLWRTDERHILGREHGHGRG